MLPKEEYNQILISRDVPKISAVFDMYCESVLGCDFCQYRNSESCILAWYFDEVKKIENNNQTSTHP